MSKTQNKEWSGERLETFITNGAMLEHLHRYAMLYEIVKGKSVLDIACGEGYGSNILSDNAAHVIAIDIDATTIEKASIKYKKENISFKKGVIENIACEDKSVDVIVCFETIEHVSDHNKVISEFKRVLKTDGLLVISTPDKLIYGKKTNSGNSFHKKELYENEFKKLISENFHSFAFYKQKSFPGSIIQSESSYEINKFYQGNYANTETNATFTPVYWIAIASNNSVPSLPSGIYMHEKSINHLLHEEANAVKKTITYRAGSILLWPIKKIKSLLGR